jgi:GNAT superfamily N-acetyltransferase
MLATLPSYQRRGIAAIQLAWATDLADEKRLTCWVEGSAVAVPLYRKFGFEVKDTIVSQCSGLDGEIPYVSSCMSQDNRMHAMAQNLILRIKKEYFISSRNTPILLRKSMNLTCVNF